MLNKKNLLVTMSGGTTTVINATLAGIIKAVRKTNEFDRVLAGFPGIQGLLSGSLVDVTSLDNEQICRLKNTPGSATIGTTRVAILNENELSAIDDIFKKNKIQAFINIGGNGTIKQTKAISKSLGRSVKIASVPKTVDNDLGDISCEDLFFTPGFPSCVNHWTKTSLLLDIENRGAFSHDKVLVAQTFGRETGFIAGSVRLIDPDRKLPLIILLPEDPQTTDTILCKIDNTLAKHNRAIVILAEGYPIGDINPIYDATGQIMYGSTKTTSSQLLVDKLFECGIQARSYIPTVLQRQAIADTLLMDIDLSEKIGYYTVGELAKGKSNFLSKVHSPSMKNDYKSIISDISFNKIDNYSRCMQEAFIDKNNFDVSDSYLNYLNLFFKISAYETSYSFRDWQFFYSDEKNIEKLTN